MLFLLHEGQDMGAVLTEPIMLSAVGSRRRIVVGPKSEELPAFQPVKSSRARWVGTVWMELLMERRSRRHFAAG